MGELNGRMLLTFCITIFVIDAAMGYNKYGRTCKDIGCLPSEACVMAEDPCSYGRQDQCGFYPTCQKKTNAVSDCNTFICPPTMICRMDGSTPKCVQDPSQKNNGSPYDTKAQQPSAPSAPPAPSAPIYPQLPGQTTTRAPIYNPGAYPSGNGYQGGSVGSGYPGYPSSGGSYPNYPSSGGAGGSYPGYPSNGGNAYPGYPQSGGGYPQSGGSGYPGYSGYPGSNGYNGYPGYNQGQNYGSNNPYAGYGGSNKYGSTNQQKPASSDSNPLFDKLSSTLKNIGSNILKQALGNIKL